MTDSDPDSTTNNNRSGGTDLSARRDIHIGGDVVGRDKTVSITTNITADLLPALEKRDATLSVKQAATYPLHKREGRIHRCR